MRVWGLWVFMTSSFAANAQSYTGDSWEQTRTNGQGTITIAYAETPAFVTKDASGKLTGICVDIMKDFVDYVSKTKNVKLEMKTVGAGANCKIMFDVVKTSQGGVFGLGNITITEGRKKEAKFGPPYISNFAIFITHNKTPMLASLEDLPVMFRGFTAYTERGTLNDKRILELKNKYLPGIRITYSESTQETLERISADPSGFAYIDLMFYLQAVKERKSVKRHPVGDKAAEQFGFAMPLNSDWGPMLEEFFNAKGGYINSTQYKRILARIWERWVLDSCKGNQ